MSVRPISPRDIADQKRHDLPDQVVACWNRLIARHFSATVSAVRQDEALDELMAFVPEGHLQPRKYIVDQGWLDVEPMYRARGWEVEYDRPGYNESYPAVFRFRAARQKYP